MTDDERAQVGAWIAAGTPRWTLASLRCRSAAAVTEAAAFCC